MLPQIPTLIAPASMCRSANRIKILIESRKNPSREQFLLATLKFSDKILRAVGLKTCTESAQGLGMGLAGSRIRLLYAKNLEAEPLRYVNTKKVKDMRHRSDSKATASCGDLGGVTS